MDEFLVDINEEIELPEYNLVLCKLNEEPIQELKNIDNFVIKAYHANIDEISFRIHFYRTESNGKMIENELYNLVDGSMMVLLNDSKYFILTKPEIRTDETTGEIYKTIVGFSREYEFIQKRLVGYDGVSRMLYDHTNQKDEYGLEIGFLNYIEKTTSWRIGYINSSLLTKYRHLSFSKSTYLQAFQEIQKTFGCLFKFDTINKMIDVYEVMQLGKNQDLYISDGNFIKSLSQSVNHDEIKTRLFLYGKNNISIQNINLTGQPYIENFNFYKNTKYMSQDLIDALCNYEDEIKKKEGQFNSYLEQIDNLNNNLSIKRIELTTLNTELKLIESELDVAISSGQPTRDLTVQQTSKINQINNKEIGINDLLSQIEIVKSNINNLGSDTSLNNYLTEEQARELDPFIREDEFSDNNYTENNLKELLDDGKEVLNRVSSPNIQFDVEVEDFLKLVEGQHMRDKFILGDLVNLEHEGLGFNYEVRLIGYTHNPDNHSLKLMFSNRNSVDDANIYLSDLLASVTTTASTVDFNRYKWDKGEDVSNKFTEYIRHELDLSRQSIIKAENQRPILDDRGLWLYKENPGGSISPEQIRAIHNVIAITKDNWNTVDVALTPEGIKSSLLMGEIILGSNLKIASDIGVIEILNNLFTVKDVQNKLRVALGNYAAGKYGLLIKDASGNKTILDEDGILQSWQEGRTDNIDTGKPLKLSLYVPSSTRVINKSILRFRREYFRAYSTATLGGGGGTRTSSDGGGGTRTSSSGGDDTTTSSNGGGSTATSYSGGGGSITAGSGVEVDWVEAYTNTVDGHRHMFDRVGSHKHVVYISSHTHEIRIPDHRHDISIRAHRHDIDIPDHRHSITIPDHTHGINYGVYENTRSNNITITINGINKTSDLGGGSGFNSDQSNLDITPYLTIGTWNTIDIGGTGLGRIDATVFIQALMNVE